MKTEEFEFIFGEQRLAKIERMKREILDYYDQNIAKAPKRTSKFGDEVPDIKETA
ncbi:hypothetical protein [Herbaspirillum aquaticum]|uniref:hypothetical protein n=1 Tax=Herbaspirillum aquaticum TaxID=568783 RepID=UPI0024DDFF75|nr:hypothetical protein [Herbaspirillum aquaticum]